MALGSSYFNGLLGRLFRRGAEQEILGGLNFTDGLELEADLTENYYNVRARNTGDEYDITHSRYGGGADKTATQNSTAFERALEDAADAGKGVIIVPGAGTYEFNEQIWVPSSNIGLSFPHGAKLKPTAEIPVLIAVGNVDTQITTTEENFLASNAAAGALTITLDAGKGANFAANGYYLLKSDAIIPGHDSAVVVETCEIISVYSVTGDVLELNRPLRYSYLTADDAQIYRVDWIEGFFADGLAIDGNDQIACSIALCMSGCLEPYVINTRFFDLQQRGIRMQYNWQARIHNYFQSNARSALFQDAGVSLNGYALSEGGACEGLRASKLQIRSCRHGYTTSGVVSNTGVSSPLNTPGFGVPSYSVIEGDHAAARGAGWDTHETGYRLTFKCRTLGSLGVGFQDRCVETRWIDCDAQDTIGAAFQIGADAQGSELTNFRHKNTNLGTDEASSTDWTRQSAIVDNGVNTRIGVPRPNHIDNGGFLLWERGTSFTANGGTANRWQLTEGTGAAVTVSRGSHGETLPEAGANFLRFQVTTAGSTNSTLSQYFDDVRSFAGKRVTLSFRMRDDLDGSLVTAHVRQYFGTGGSPSADVTTTPVTRRVDGSWRKYNLQIDVPLLTGKTIGTAEDSYLQLVITFPLSVALWDIDNVKLEVGDTVTDYVPRTLAEEKRACVLWYEKSYNDGQDPGSASTGGRQQIAAYQTGLTDAKIANLYTRTVHMARKGRTPTCSTYAAGSGTAGTIRNNTQAIDVDRDIVAGFQSFQVSPTVAAVTAGNVVSGDELEFHWTAAVPLFE